jgi:hypothetical protein
VRVTATEAKKHFGSLCAQAKADTAGRAARKHAFESEFGGWIAAQNTHFEAHGIPGAGLRPWWAADRGADRPLSSARVSARDAVLSGI